jgi:membrane protease YdiL (CAAX protease family)
MPWDFWLIFLVLGVVIPWRGRARLKRLLALPVIGTKEKLVLYGTTTVFQWVLVAFVAWRGLARGFTARQLGFCWGGTAELLFLSAGGAALLGVFQWFNLRRMGQMTGAAAGFMRQLAERILPGKTVEFAPYCVLAATAGFCEEFIYRGFVMAALGRAGMASPAVVVISSMLFGMAHSYQGKRGILATMLMGFLFGTFRLAFLSLVPVMVWHATVDLVAGIAAPKYLLRERKAE